MRWRTVMAMNWRAAIVAGVKKAWLTVQGPDPQEMIALYRERQVAERKESEDLVTASEALVSATQNLLGAYSLLRAYQP
jgi:hypothetical protein